MTTCSMDALATAEPLAGTAPFASAWIIIEQPGSWGRAALDNNRLGPAITQHLSTAKAHGVGVLLARHPDRPTRDRNCERNIWVARSAAGGHLLRHAILDSLDDILQWDLAAIGTGQLPAIGTIDAAPTVFVCTHSRRDRCCAIEGRALITNLLDDAVDRERIWECSHVGGHRFAPVVLTLPSGSVHGRLDIAQAREVVRLSTTREVVVDRLRGQSALVAPFQVAAIEVMRLIGETRADQVDVLRLIGGRAVPMPPGNDLDHAITEVVAEVRHRDGRAWRASLKQASLERLRLESCEKTAVHGTTWECVELSAATDWA